MRRRLPSLNALRAFEAAARHGSMSRAADELTVTPSALSRQISVLEAHFACKLFQRNRRGVTLTEKGSTFSRAIADAFDRIDAASNHLAGQFSETQLSLRVFPTFATEWLIPRLSAFKALYPGIGIRLIATLQNVDFEVDEADMGVLLGPGRWPGLRHDLLFQPRFFPVCSPAVLETGPPLITPVDLKHETLLYSQIQIRNWHAWLDRARVTDIDLDRGLWFESSSLAYHAAREGAGIVLGQRLFLADDLIPGRLVAPFGITLLAQQYYCLVCLDRRQEEPQIVAFRNWLIEEVRKSERLAEQKLPGLEARVFSI